MAASGAKSTSATPTLGWSGTEPTRGPTPHPTKGWIRVQEETPLARIPYADPKPPAHAAAAHCQASGPLRLRHVQAVARPDRLGPRKETMAHPATTIGRRQALRRMVALGAVPAFAAA